MTTKRKDRRMLIRFGVAAGAVAVVGVAIAAAATLPGGDSSPLPATTPTPTESPRPTVSPTASPESPGSADCSAVALRDEISYPQDPQPEVPTAVAEMREHIVDAALRCDYDALNAFALDGRDFFSYSFGDPDEEPGEYWRMIEEAKPRFREPVLSLLVQTFDLSYCTDQFDDPDGDGRVTVYVWPSASCNRPTDEQWAELESLYSDEEIRGWKDFGSFIGWRIGIFDDGDWTSYIAGD